jgi:hypothetical protein
MSDVYTNTMGHVMVIAPTPNGQLQALADSKNIAFADDLAVKSVLTRWVFADFPTGTLIDEWGNRYDHQVHSLLSGTLAEGREFLETLSELGCVVEEASEFFVPFQKLNLTSVESSDALRMEHSRAFVLARRGRKSIAAIVTDIRDAGLLGS